MKIIAASAVPTGENAENVLQIANDADLAALHASGALQGVERIELQIDQLVHMHRSGFSSAVLAGGVDASAAERQFARFAAFYQGDVNEPRPLFAREAA